MVVLNVMLLSISGMVGLGFLLQTLRRLSAAGEADWKPATVSAQPMDSAAGAAASTRQPGPLEHVEGLYTESGMRASRNIFRIWVILFGLVGAQMGWLLRPFIGRPDAPFTWFRSREGNFFLGLMQHIKTLLDPGS
jgi:hypothetical protein